MFWDSEWISAPQDLQNRLSSEFSTEHLGQLIMLFPWCPSRNGPFEQSLRHTHIVILEIPQCIPVVTIFAFLDLVQKISFLDRHYLRVKRKASYWKEISFWEIKYMETGAVCQQKISMTYFMSISRMTTFSQWVLITVFFSYVVTQANENYVQLQYTV